LTRQPLPIDIHLPELVRMSASHPCLVLEAPPGTGKTTRVAPALLTEPNAGQVILIQPRRIAARAAAARIAQELGSEVGQQVGYQVRFDKCCTQATELISMTPGILLRRLQHDPLLENVAVVILDEFHERSLEVDLVLGMLRRIQVELRPELRLVIMSATLNTAGLEQLLGAPPVLRVAAQAYPVDLRFSRFQSTQRGGYPVSPTRRIIEQTTTALLDASRAHAGDMLVFLPGVSEIMQVARNVQAEADKQGWDLLTLFGDMSPKDQDRVLKPSASRKVILATNVAETSLTIDGVTVVIDSGWSRVQRVDPNLGLNMLVLEPISQASATQRAGRAGRTAPGICYRLWDEATDRGRLPHLEPEILRVDLAGAALQLLAWGETDCSQFPWITPPRDTAWNAALRALQLIDATSSDGRVTELGKSLLRLPVHPRIGRFLVEAHRLQVPAAGAVAAALLSERDVFDQRRAVSRPGQSIERTPPHACDLTHRVQLLRNFNQRSSLKTSLGMIKPEAAYNVLRVAEQFQKLLVAEFGKLPEAPLTDQLQRALLTAFPDRLARRRAPGSPRGLMVGGRGVKLESSSGVQQSELFLCLDVDAVASEASVRKASAIAADWLPMEHLCEVDEKFFNPTQGAVVTRRRLYWLDLLLSETPMATIPDEETAQLLSTEAAKQFQRLLPPKDKELQSWLARVAWLAHANPELGLPTLEATSLAELLTQWCYGWRSLDELRALPWKNLLPNMLNANQRKLLDAQAPETVTLPTGRAVYLQYEIGKPPVLAARIQEFFGLKSTPRLAGGRVPLLLHLLAPNNRCQQITDDLASFWSNTYPTVRKELRTRYPKHAWPEVPP